MKDVKEELEKGKRYHAASKEEKRILESKSYREEIKNSANKGVDEPGTLDRFVGKTIEKFKKIKSPEKKIQKT